VFLFSPTPILKNTLSIMRQIENEKSEIIKVINTTALLKAYCFRKKVKDVITKSPIIKPNQLFKIKNDFLR
jgi:hypothetical protein